mmetsp:Transcript_18575/g.18660  ORF Transcript_18575/g.18660 Transcript_18575/m.18660 type:complete len:305 (-) Transcript_18575:44-958(-)|eukprot:CAMPEP_0182420110 /NCGR_PEP_ID=MMETSP1167-20130531/4648_1 /TAXON_ID=2988 /ORGANISM="Mallomonas Sp, Strain CCMP3275" /LENGTH=304 /DNA_ID=CAMNT_0024595593 /DNA_START=94 /DNA_END=1008 /DNA_ORIENTATION=+
MESINVLLGRLETDQKNPSNQFIGTLIKTLRSSQVRRPDIVTKYGWKYLQSGVPSNEVWILHEQIFTAALDIGDLALADKCLGPLKANFPGSSRVRLLEGMIQEAKSDYTEALAIYDTLLVAKASNIFALKRKVCVYKAKGDIEGAIGQLNDILGIYQSDVSSWLELAELYISISNYSHAAFCFEELILINHAGVAYHIRLAEVYYTLGGVENLLKARKHYVLARSLQGEHTLSLRTLYGLVATCNSLLANKRHTSGSDGAVTSALLTEALEQIALKAKKQKSLQSKGTQIDDVLMVLQKITEE